MYLRHITGKNGENIAVEYLIKNEYKIIERNFSCKTGEIDIIALEKNTLIFIEVKTRTNNLYGMPSEAITSKKLKNMYKTARYYTYIKNLQDQNIRFDAIEIYINGDKYKINHILQIL